MTLKDEYQKVKNRKKPSPATLVFYYLIAIVLIALSLGIVSKAPME